MKTIQNSTGRFDVLDGTRGVAAICVMLFHYTTTTNLTSLPHTNWKIFNSGPLAVDLFFMLSGFVLLHAYGEKLRRGMPKWRVLIQRAIRLYPMFAIGQVIGAAAIAAVCMRTVQFVAPVYATQDFLINLFFLPSFLPGNVVGVGETAAPGFSIFLFNPPAWSLFFEAIASIAFLWVSGWRTSTKAAFTGIAFVLFVVFARQLADQDGWPGFDFDMGVRRETLFWGLARVGFGFGLGMCCYDLWTRCRDRLLASTQRWQLRVPSIAIYVLVFGFLAFPVYAHGFYALLFLMVIAPLTLLAGAALEGDEGARPTVRRISHALGWISYPLYCVHVPVGRLVWSAFRNGAGLSTGGLVGVTLLCCVAAIAIAAISAKYIEEPSRKWLTQRFFQNAPRGIGGKPAEASASDSL